MTTNTKHKQTPRRGRRLKSWTWFDYVNTIFLILLSIIMIFPLYYTLIVSFASYESIINSKLYLWPTSFSLEAYKFIFQGSGDILHSFGISVFTTVVGTALSMVVSIGLAYGLCKKNLPGYKFFTVFIVFTMLFDAGTIPYYLTVKSLHLVDTIWVLIIPTAAKAYYIILLRNYMRSIAPELEESARLDGANDVQILWHIILPVSKPILATVGLFYAVDKWNEWWHSFMFIVSPDKKPLQLILREILFNYSQMMSSSVGMAIMAARRPMYGRSLQMAIVVVACVPIMCVYPYLQKHFTKGIMVGSVKG